MKRLIFVLLFLSVSAFAQNGGPLVSITSPANGASFTAPANITISATASDSSSSQIQSVDFFNGNTLIARAVSAPYSVTWSNVATGSYSLTAVATDTAGLTATSNQVNITVNGAVDQPPTVSLTSPASGATFTAPASITVSASASDSDGTVTQVQFFAGSTLIGTATAAPYTITWSNVAAGSYSLTAKATDNAGLTTTSGAVSVTVNGPLYQGFLDAANCNIIGGWAWNANQPNTAIGVDIYDGSTRIATTTANLFRQDLLNAGIGNGNHAFNISTPAGVKDGNTHTIAAKFGGTSISLSTSPKTLNCPPVIQGFKVDANMAQFNSPGATISIDGGTQTFGPTVNPYASSVTAGSHTVTSSTPAGFSVSYSVCNNCTDHSATGGHPFVAGTSVTVNVTAGGYVDLWWKYTAMADLPPTANITSPANGASFSAPASIAIKATASDSDGTVTRVDFLANGAVVGTVTTPPYNFTWNNVAAGSYALTATATDNAGLTGTSSTVSVTVTSPDQPPTVSIATPSDGAVFASPATIPLSAIASDSDGTVTKVDFLANGTLIGTVTSAPYNFTWTNVASGTYKLTAVATDNAGLPATSSAINITVISTPLPVAMLDPANRTGSPGEDLLSGNYNWRVPVVTLKGRAGSDLYLELIYNSGLWTKAGSEIFYDADRGFPSPGFHLGFPVVLSSPYPSQAGLAALLLIMPTGRRVELRQVGSSNLYESGDSTHLQLFVNGTAATLKFPDGAVASLQLVSSKGEYHVTQIEDRNGNLITIALDPATGNINTITDTLGRVITLNYDGNGRLQSITQPWSGGITHTWASFNYATLTAQPNFVSGLTPVGLQANQQISVLAGVTLADNTTFGFTYTPFGQVTAIGKRSPDNTQQLSNVAYDLPVSAAQSDSPRFSNRTDTVLNWNNNQPVTTTFSFNRAMFTGQAQYSGLTKQDTYYSSGFQKGLLQQTVVSGSTGSVTSSYTYTQPDPTLPYPQNPILSDSTTSDGVGTQHTTVLSFTSANLPQSGTTVLLPGDVLQSTDGTVSTQLEKTHTDYNLAPAYMNANIIGLVSAVSVVDNNNVLLWQVEGVYDNCLSDPGAPIQHDPTRDISFTTRGLICTVIRHDVTNPSNTLTTSHTYDTGGSVLSTTDPMGHTSRVSYTDNFTDAVNRNTFAYPTSTTDADGFMATVTYDYPNGAITVTHDPLGAELRLSYDPIGRLSQKTYHDSVANQDATFTSFTYDSNGTKTHLLTLLDPKVKSIGTEIMDGAGRVIATSGNFPGGTSGLRGRQFSYDSFGRLASSSKETEFQATNPDDPSTWTATGGDSAFVFTTYTYDYLGRPLVTVNQGDNSSRSLSYSGCDCAGGGSTTSTDEVNRQQNQFYDGLGRVTEVDIFKFDGTLDSRRTITYNGLTTTTQVVDLATSETQITTQIFDGFGRLQSQHSPQQTPGKNTTYVFNQDDTLSSITDARGAKKVYSYNNRGLATGVNVFKPDGNPASALTMTYAYDAAGNRTLMSDISGTWAADYDVFSRIKDETRTFAGVPGSFTLTYQRNLFGQLTQIQDPFGATFNFAHDASGALTSITGSGPNTFPTYVGQMSYFASGVPQQIQFGNGAVAHFVYYPTQNLKHYVVNGTSGSNVQDYRYAYTLDRRISQLTDNIDSTLDRSFAFDHQGRLTEAHTGASIGQDCASLNLTTAPTWYCESFQYDAFGNPLVSNMVSTISIFGPYVPILATYTNNRNNGWQYDDDGRPLSQDPPNVSNSYDAAGHLVTTVNSNGLHGTSKQKVTIQTVFDGDDALAAQTTLTGSEQVTKYFLRSSALNGAVVAEINPSGLEMTSFVYANGTLVAKNETAQAPSVAGTFWVHRDPVTGSEFDTSTPAVGISAQETQLDPLGRDFGVAGPGSFVNGVIGYPDVGAFFDLSSGCTLDGWATPCANLLRMIQHSDAFAPDPAFGAVNTIFDRPGGPLGGQSPDDPSKNPPAKNPDTTSFDAYSTEYLAVDTTNVDGSTKKQTQQSKWDVYIVIERYPDGHIEWVYYYGYGHSLAERIAESQAIRWAQYQMAAQQQAARQQATQPKYSFAASVVGGFLNGITLPFDLFARAILGHDVQDRQITGAAQASHPVAGGAAEFLGALVTVPVGGEADVVELGIEAAEVEGAKATGNAYSVAFEMKLDPIDVAISDSVHFNRANKALDGAIRSDAEFAAQMEELIPGVSENVSRVGGRKVPPGWTWHHAQDYGVMQLVPRVQHESSLFREAFHPGGTGGYADWAFPAGARARH